MKFMGCMGLVYGNILEGLGEFSRYTTFEVDDGSKISFWYGVWCGDQSLKVRFPELFNSAHVRDAFVADHTTI